MDAGRLPPGADPAAAVAPNAAPAAAAAPGAALAAGAPSRAAVTPGAGLAAGATHLAFTAAPLCAAGSLHAGLASPTAIGPPPPGLTAPRSDRTGGSPPFIDGLGPLRDATPMALRRGSPPGFPTMPVPAEHNPSLVAAIATIQAAVAASRERERATSLALEHERALGAALTTQMATAQRLLLGRPSVAREDPPTPPAAIPATGLDVDHIGALHAQAAGLHNIRALVSVVLDPASSHYPRWRGQVLLTLRRYALADHVLDDLDAPPTPSWCLMDISPEPLLSFARPHTLAIDVTPPPPVARHPSVPPTAPRPPLKSLEAIVAYPSSLCLNFALRRCLDIAGVLWTTIHVVE
eukprot:XP_020399068.1 mRNA decay activator protein ZFP36L3-like [Zea mays]